MLTFIKNTENEHLTHEHFLDLLERYYDKENLDQLSASFNLGKYNSKTLPKVTIKGHQSLLYNCPVCSNGIMEYQLRGRTSYYSKEPKKFSLDEIDFFLTRAKCNSCKHCLTNCFCSYCKKIAAEERERERTERSYRQNKERLRKQAEEELERKKQIEEQEELNSEKREFLRSYYDRATYSYHLDELPADRLVCLYALGLPLITHPDFENLINPKIRLNIAEKIVPLYFRRAFFDKLDGVLTVSGESPIDAFNFIDNTVSSYYVHKVYYNINLDDWKDIKEIPTYLSNQNKISWREENNRECLTDLLKELKIYECYEYLEYEANKLKITFEPNDKIKVAIIEILQSFKVEQVFSLINTATRATAYQIVERSLTAKHAFNLWVCLIESTFEKAMLYGWDVPHFSRPESCQKSLLRNIIDSLI